MSAPLFRSPYVRLAIALAPALVTLGGWGAAALVYRALGCRGGLKDLAPCPLLGVDVQLLIGVGLFWCQLLVTPRCLASLALLVWLAPPREGPPRG